MGHHIPLGISNLVMWSMTKVDRIDTGAANLQDEKVDGSEQELSHPNLSTGHRNLERGGCLTPCLEGEGGVSTSAFFAWVSNFNPALSRI